MAFIRNKNDLILTLVVLSLPSIAATIDCNGKPFHCLNSTHFMICVDFGSGVSSTMDDFVIPCPPTTVCQATNRFECEFPTVATITKAPVVTETPLVAPFESETVTEIFYDVTTVPFEEYFNILSTTTLSTALLTQNAVTTQSSIIDVNENISVAPETINTNDTTLHVLQNISVAPETINTNDTTLHVLQNISVAPETINTNDTTLHVLQNDFPELTTLGNTTLIAAVTEGISDVSKSNLTSSYNSTNSNNIIATDISSIDLSEIDPVTVTENYETNSTLLETIIGATNYDQFAVQFTSLLNVTSALPFYNVTEPTFSDVTETSTNVPFNVIHRLELGNKTVDSITKIKPEEIIESDHWIQSQSHKINETIPSDLAQYNSTTHHTVNISNLPSSTTDIVIIDDPVVSIHEFITNFSLNDNDTMDYDKINLKSSTIVKYNANDIISLVTETIRPETTVTANSIKQELSTTLFDTVNITNIPINEAIPANDSSLTINIKTVDVVTENYNVVVVSENKTTNTVNVAFPPNTFIKTTEATVTYSRDDTFITYPQNKTYATENNMLKGIDLVVNDPAAIGMTGTEKNESESIDLCIPNPVTKHDENLAQLDVLTNNKTIDYLSISRSVETETFTNLPSNITKPENEIILSTNSVITDNIKKTLTSGSEKNINILIINDNVNSNLLQPVTESKKDKLLSIPFVDSDLLVDNGKILENSSIAIPNITKLDVSGKEINKTSRINYVSNDTNIVPKINMNFTNKTEPIQAWSVSTTDDNINTIDIVEKTLNHTFETTTPEVVSVTYSNIYYQTDTKDLKVVNDQEKPYDTESRPVLRKYSLYPKESFIHPSDDKISTTNGINMLVTNNSPEATLNMPIVDGNTVFVTANPITNVNGVTELTTLETISNIAVESRLFAAELITSFSEEPTESVNITQSTIENTTTAKSVYNPTLEESNAVDSKFTTTESSKNFEISASLHNDQNVLQITETPHDFTTNVYKATDFSFNSGMRVNFDQRNDTNVDAKKNDSIGLRLTIDKEDSFLTLYHEINKDSVFIHTVTEANSISNNVNNQIQQDTPLESLSQNKSDQLNTHNLFFGNEDLALFSKVESITESIVRIEKPNKNTNLVPNITPVSGTVRNPNSIPNLAQSTESWRATIETQPSDQTTEDFTEQTLIQSSEHTTKPYDTSTVNVIRVTATLESQNNNVVQVTKPSYEPTQKREKMLNDMTNQDLVASNPNNISEFVPAKELKNDSTNIETMGKVTADPNLDVVDFIRPIVMSDVLLTTEPSVRSTAQTSKETNSITQKPDVHSITKTSARPTTQTSNGINSTTQKPDVLPITEPSMRPIAQTSNEMNWTTHKPDVLSITKTSVRSTTQTSRMYSTTQKPDVLSITEPSVPSTDQTSNGMNSITQNPDVPLSKKPSVESTAQISNENDHITTKPNVTSSTVPSVGSTVQTLTEISSISQKSDVLSSTESSVGPTDQIFNVINVIMRAQDQELSTTETNYINVAPSTSPSIIITELEKTSITESSMEPVAQLLHETNIYKPDLQELELTTEKHLINVPSPVQLVNPAVEDTVTPLKNFTLTTAPADNNNIPKGTREVVLNDMTNQDLVASNPNNISESVPAKEFKNDSTNIVTMGKVTADPNLDIVDFIRPMVTSDDLLTTETSVRPTDQTSNGINRTTHKPVVHSITKTSARPTTQTSTGINSTTQKSDVLPITEPSVRPIAQTSNGINWTTHKPDVLSITKTSVRSTTQTSNGIYSTKQKPDVLSITEPSVPSTGQTSIGMNSITQNPDVPLSKKPSVGSPAQTSNGNDDTTTKPNVTSSTEPSVGSTVQTLTEISSISQKSDVLSSTESSMGPTDQIFNVINVIMRVQDQELSTTETNYINVAPSTSPSIITTELTKTSITESSREPVSQLLPETNIYKADLQELELVNPAVEDTVPLKNLTLTTTPADNNNISKGTREMVLNDMTNHDLVASNPNNISESMPAKDFKNDSTNIVTMGKVTGDANLDIIDFIRPIASLYFVEHANESTHSGISAIPKPTSQQKNKHESSIDLNKKEHNSDKGETPEAREESENNPVKSAIVSSTASKSASDISHSIYLNSMLTPVGHTHPNTLRIHSAIEKTTKKVEVTSNFHHSNINIEQLASTERSFTNKLINTNNPHSIYPIPKDISVRNNSAETKPFVQEKNSRDRYSPKTKSYSANTHNSSYPAFKTSKHNFVCKSNKRGRFSDNEDCRKFYICIGKHEPIMGVCPNNTVFSQIRKQCTKNLSHCVRNNQFQCISEGRFSDHLNDNMYYICVMKNEAKFIRFKLQCQSGYHLNKTAVRCALNTESPPSTSQQSTSDISTSNQSASDKSEKLADKRNKFECKREGKFPEINDCRKYYICTKLGKSEYRKKSKRCDRDELYNRDKKKCVDADSYECSPLSTVL